MGIFQTKKSNVVIIGLGGIVGASVMHHLVARGWQDIVGIDKTSVPTDIGSTSHASDFCYATDHSKFNCYTRATVSSSTTKWVTMPALVAWR